MGLLVALGAADWHDAEAHALLVGLVYTAPGLLLLAALAAGRYPGEALIARARGSRRSPRAALESVLPVARPSRVLAPRGGALLAYGRAVRPPPPISVAA